MTLSKRESPIFQCAMFRFYVKPWQGIIIFLSPGLGWIYSSYTYDCYDHRTSAKNCDQTFSHALRMRWMVGWGARCKSLSGRRVKSCQTRAIKSIKTPSWKSDHGINKWIKFCNRFSVQSFWQGAQIMTFQHGFDRVSDPRQVPMTLNPKNRDRYQSVVVHKLVVDQPEAIHFRVCK